MAANPDDAAVGVHPEGDGVARGRTVWADGRQATERVLGQALELSLSEDRAATLTRKPKLRSRPVRPLVTSRARLGDVSGRRSAQRLGGALAPPHARRDRGDSAVGRSGRDPGISSGVGPGPPPAWQRSSGLRRPRRSACPWRRSLGTSTACGAVSPAGRRRRDCIAGAAPLPHVGSQSPPTPHRGSPPRRVGRRVTRRSCRGICRGNARGARIGRQIGTRGGSSESVKCSIGPVAQR